MALRDLIARFTIVGNTDGAEKANKALEGIKSRIDQLIGFEAIKGLAELAERFAKMGEELKVSAESLGIGVEEFQQLSVAASQSAVSQDQLATSMSRLSRSLFEAKTGSIEAQEVFARLGVQPGQISGLHNANEALVLLSGRLTQMTDPIAKLALVQKTLGRGSMEMVAFLSQGPAAIAEKMKQAAKDGLVLSDAQVNGLEKMNHAFEKLEQKLKVIMGSLIEPLAPLIENLVNSFVKLYNTNKQWIELDFISFAGKIAFVLGFIEGFTTTVYNNLKRKFPDGILAGLFGKMDIADKVTILVAALTPVIPVLEGIAAAMAAWAIEMAPVIAGIQVIHDSAELLFGEGSLADRWKKTWTSKELGFADQHLRQGPLEKLKAYAEEKKGSSGGPTDGGTSILSLARGGAAGGGVAVSSPQTNIYNIHGADPHSVKRQVEDLHKKHDERIRRGIFDAVGGSKVGSVPGVPK